VVAATNSPRLHRRNVSKAELEGLFVDELALLEREGMSSIMS
jgi:hypothetical protein